MANGGDISVFDLTVTSSIIGYKTGRNLAEAPVGRPDANGNLIGGPIHGIIDPLLGPLRDNGGPTMTHALLPGSPALNAGDPSIPFLATEFDQRGVGYSRVAFDRIDIGAYEAQIAPSADFDSDGDVDGSDFLTWQRGFGQANALRMDGNSDDDTDVDASDLAAWTVSFGQPQPLVATLRSPAAFSPEPVDADAKSGDVTQLFDAAMAWGLANPTGDEAEDLEIATPTAVKAVFASPRDAAERYPTASDAAEDILLSAAKSNAEKQSDPWLDEKLLDHVFG